jgi:OFA family oxalate/formate antiporter-like MFS transporter
MQGRRLQALAGAALLSLVLGSVHAFSVLLLAIEAELGVSRGLASLTYSIAVAALAFAVLLGHPFYPRLRPPVMVTVVGMLASAGCAIAASAEALPLIWLGYGVIFGAANGLGYGYALQFAGRALPDRRGMAMGIITAAYAFGAMAFSLPLQWMVSSGGLQAALLLLAAALVLIPLLSALMLWRSGKVFDAGAAESVAASPVSGARTAMLWLGYGCSVLAGLMVLGHATGIAEAAGTGVGWIIAAPIIAAAANMAGSLTGGALLDRAEGRTVISGLALTTLASLLLIALAQDPVLVLGGLGVAGFAYGGTIAAYPAFLSRRFGAAGGTIVYGRVFTAWAAAGLLGPWAAGGFFDWSGSYLPALILAGVLAAGSAALHRFGLRG